MSTETPNPDHTAAGRPLDPSVHPTDPTDPTAQATRDIAEVPAVEGITTAAIHLMSAAAVKCGLADGPDSAEHLDLD